MKEQKQIAKNYSQALFELGNNDLNLQESFLNELEIINESISQVKDAKKVFENPGITKDEKKELIKKLFFGKTNQKILNFLFLLIDKQRFNLLPEIQNHLITLVNQKRGILIAEVYSPQEIDGSMAKTIVETLRRSISTTNDIKEIKINQRIDSSLIGGLKIKINDLVYDGTIKGRLENLKRRLG